MLSTSQDDGDQARAEFASLIDLQMSPLGIAAMDALAPTRGQTVLDVGCGAGETVLQMAGRVGESGQVVGVDIGPRVLAVARARAGNLQQVTLIQEDAARLGLPDHSLDCVFSRFGTMFFADPIAAFANMRRMLRPGGRIGFVCWRSMRENELDFFPVEAAGLASMVDSTPFSFENPDTIERTLRAAGYSDIGIEAYDVQVSCGDASMTSRVVTRVGALGKVLRETPALLPEAEAQVRRALSLRERGGCVSLGAATWIVTAVAE